MDYTATAKLATRPDEGHREGPRDKPLYLHLIERAFAELGELDIAVNRLAVRLSPVSAAPDPDESPEVVEAMPLYRTELEGQVGNIVETLIRIRRSVGYVTEAVRL